MKKYHKDPGQCTHHGLEYEENLLLYYVLKSYKSEWNFEIFNGQKGIKKWDDIVLKTENFEISVQAKHRKDTNGYLSENQLLSEKGRYSLNVYLKAAHQHFSKKSREKEYFFCLVTNKPTCRQLIKVEEDSIPDTLKNFENFKNLYNFKTEKFLNKLSTHVSNEKSEIPKDFIEFFLERFYLVIISDDPLRKNINELLSSVPDEIRYEDFYNEIKEWRSNRKGIGLTKSEIEAYFSAVISKKFEEKLKIHRDSLKSTINLSRHLITIVKSPRYFLIMTLLQNMFEKKQPLFVNPYMKLKKQKMLINAFLHEKYTELICVVQNDHDELTRALSYVVSVIEQNQKFLTYKKIILLCCEDIEVGIPVNREIIKDYQWFEKCSLHFERKSCTRSDLTGYYRDRFLSCSGSGESEVDFLKNIFKNNNDFVVISASPGMGKTSVLSSLAIKVNKAHKYWSKIIHLNLFTQLLERHTKFNSELNLDEFLNISEENIFERQICQIPNVLVLMFDGFDEISPNYKNIVLKLLKETKRMENVKTTFVTTREHLKDDLENEFGVRAYKLKPLTKQSICSLITKYGKKHLETVEKWYSSLTSDVRDMLENPLHAKLFAESFPNLGTELPTIYELYDSFMNKNNDLIFIQQKCRAEGNLRVKELQNDRFPDLLEIYTALALQMTFKKEKLRKLGISEISESAFNENLWANGILECVQGTCRFVHETFREFFVAKYVVRNMFQPKEFNSEITIILKDILLMFNTIKHFIDGYLEKNWNQITDEVFQRFGDIFSHDWELTNMFDINYDCLHIIKIILRNCEKPSVINSLYEKFVNPNTGFTSPELIKLLISKGADSSYKNKEGMTVLHVAVERGHLDLVKYLIEGNRRQIDKEELNGALVVAVSKNNIEICQYLINQGAEH